MATPITQTIPQQSRPAGTYLLGPVTLPAGYAVLSVQYNLNTASYENTANQIVMKVEVSKDGVAWQEIAGDTGWTWQGGQVVRHGVTDPPPVNEIGIAPWSDGTYQIRAGVTLNRTMTAGMTLTLS